MTREQIQWAYNHVERITNKYLTVFPLNDETWQQLLDEVKEVHKLSKENEVVKDLLLLVVNYFDKLDATYRKETKDG